MIDPVQNSYAAYQTQIRHVGNLDSRHVTTAASQPGNQTIEDLVDVSQLGKMMATAFSHMKASTPGSGRSLQAAEHELATLMQRFDIPQTTGVTITMEEDGSFTVEGEHTDLAKIEQHLNSGDPSFLRDALQEAREILEFRDLADEADRVKQAAISRPDLAEQFFEDFQAFSKQPRSSGLMVVWSGEALTASLKPPVLDQPIT